MIPLNIDDLRCLMSVLIQILPTVLSITLIALFAFPGLTRGIKEKIKKCIRFSILMIVIFFIAIGLDIIVLMGLEYYYENAKWLPLIAIGVSGLAIFYLYIFMVWILIEFHKNQ